MVECTLIKGMQLFCCMALDFLSSLAYPMITHRPSIAGDLPMVARQQPTMHGMELHLHDCIYIVKPLIAAPPKSRQPPNSGQILCPRLILPYKWYIWNLQDADNLCTPDNGQTTCPRMTDRHTKSPLNHITISMYVHLVINHTPTGIFEGHGL